jgi:hypothetical protein
MFNTNYCVSTVSRDYEHSKDVWTLVSTAAFSVTASASDKCFCKPSIHHYFISVALCKFWYNLINNILQSHGNVNTVKLYGPPYTITVTANNYCEQSKHSFSKF